MSDLAHDSHISIATAYRYLHEGLGVIAEHAPDLYEVLAGARDQGLAYLCVDGTLIPIDRVAQRTERGNNTWYSGKNHQFSANIQVISDPNGHPLWVSAVRPGSVHDLRCARELVLPTLYPFCRLGPSGHSLLPVLARPMTARATSALASACASLTDAPPAGRSSTALRARTTACTLRCAHRASGPTPCCSTGTPWTT